MSHRERVLAVLSGKQTDLVPWFGDLDYYATALITRGLRPADFRDQDDYIDWHRQLGVGFYQQASWPYREVIEGCDIREWRDGPVHHREIATPVGTLRERWQWSDITFSEAPIERLLKNAEELPAYRYRFQHTRYMPDYAAAERRKRQVGGMGLVMCFLPWSPLMRMVVMDAGIENVVTSTPTRPRNSTRQSSC